MGWGIGEDRHPGDLPRLFSGPFFGGLLILIFGGHFLKLELIQRALLSGLAPGTGTLSQGLVDFVLIVSFGDL